MGDGEGIKQAVILAGGLGTRLWPLTKDKPKPMVLVNKRPFLWYLLKLLKDNGIKEVILLTGYLAEQIQDYFGDGFDFGVKLKYSISSVSTETGKRIKNAAKLLDKTFLLMYCDNYWPLNLRKVSESYESSGKKYMMTVYSNLLDITRNNVLFRDNLVLKYDKERKEKNLNGVDIGFFILKRDILDIMPDSNFSFEKEIIPLLIKKQELPAYVTNLRYYSISTPERLKLAEKFLKPKRFVLCDRDGIINLKPGKAQYIKSWSEFRMLPDAVKSLRLLKKNGFKVILVTNQAGVGRGVMNEKDLAEIHENMQRILKKGNAEFYAIYVCPHDWEEGCECRKPKPGMLLKASNDFSFDLTKSYFIGDDERDVESGRAAECKTILISRNKDSKYSVKICPDVTCKSFYDAAKFIVKDAERNLRMGKIV